MRFNIDNPQEDLNITSLSSSGNQPTAPVSTPPTLEQLRQSVAQRRFRRRAIRSAGSLAAIGLVAVTVVALRSNVPVATDAEPRSLAVNDETSLPGTATPIDESDARMQVLARVMQPEPIFQVDPETQQAWQVGWIETEFSVPVDIKHFSPAQRERFQNVLYRNDNQPSL